MTEGLSLALPITETAGEQTDLAALVEIYSTTLFRVAHSILRNPAEAEDVVQDTFVRVLQHHNKLSAIRDHRVWLIRIAWNLALDRQRRNRPDQIDELFAQTLVAPNLPADIALDEARRITATLRQIDLLPKKEREVLLLSTLDELSTTEISTVVAKSESAVRALLFRARTHLRERLEKGGHQ